MRGSVADADQFLTLAKFRALRLLWARIEESCGLTPKPLFIAAETAWRMLTQRDPYVNMLRATMATFSAGLGGANAITVLPHTLALGLPDAFARRVARNTQLVLLEESNLAKVSDPAAGSGGIETLTQRTLRSRMVAVPGDREGRRRVRRARQNLIQRKVAATRAAREADIAKRKDVLTGASEFPNLHEARASGAEGQAGRARALRQGEDQVRRAAADAAGRAVRSAARQVGSPAGTQGRAAEGVSRQSRHARRLHRARRPSPRASSRPAASRRSTPRALPIRRRSPPPSRHPARRWRACARPTRSMPAQAAAAAKALQAAGAKHIYLAGRPGEQEAALRAAGVQRLHLCRRRRADDAAARPGSGSREHDRRRRNPS